MKNIILPLLFLTLISTSQAWPWDKKPTAIATPTPKPVAAIAVTNTNSSNLQQAKALIKDLNSELGKAKEENSKLKSNLVSATERVRDAETRTVEVQRQADSLKQWGLQKEQEANQWFEKYNSAVKRYHFLKNIAATIAAIAGAMLGMYCMRIVPPVYAAYAVLLPIAGAILAFGGVWLFL